MYAIRSYYDWTGRVFPWWVSAKSLFTDEELEELKDIVFIDENMPGISGLEILPRIKLYEPDLPIIMVTKREEEEVMDEAIGSKIVITSYSIHYTKLYDFYQTRSGQLPSVRLCLDLTLE